MGICVAQLDATLIERGIATSPKALQCTDILVAVVKKIPYFLEEVKNKSKFHITIGHQTVIGTAIFFAPKETLPDIDLTFNKGVLKNSRHTMTIDTSFEYQFID